MNKVFKTSFLIATITLLAACTTKTATPTAIPTIESIPTDIPEPTVVLKTMYPNATLAPSPKLEKPLSNSKITSPLKVTGTVPAGWMFEGSCPIKLLDSENQVIAQTTAKEITPGSWQSEKDIPFTATLIFKTDTTKGFLVIENDNPSGLPENSQSYMIPIKF